MQTHPEQDTPKLLDALLIVGEVAKDQPATSKQVDAEGLLRKFFGHATSTLYLVHGTANQGLTLLPADKRFVDIGSINVLVRAALEAFLVFHYICIDGESDDEREFRYKAWVRAGLLDRQKYPASTVERQRKQAEEKAFIKRLEDELKANSFATNLSRDNQKRFQKGEWRFLSWSKIALSAGLSELHAQHMYAHLCGYAHASNLSVTQIYQATDPDFKQELYRASLLLLNIATAGMVKAYASLNPAAIQALTGVSELHELVEKWVQRGQL